jgi:hypothetical protein
VANGRVAVEQYRQGDVLLVRIDKLPRGLRQVPRDGGRVVLAYGEATGHAHAIADTGADLLASDLEERFLRIVGDFATLTHEEHAPITLPRGAYRVVRQREYTPNALRTPSTVAD